MSAPAPLAELPDAATPLCDFGIAARAFLEKSRDGAPAYVGTLNYFGILLPAEVRRATGGVELLVFYPPATALHTSGVP